MIIKDLKRIYWDWRGTLLTSARRLRDRLIWALAVVIDIGEMIGLAVRVSRIRRSDAARTASSGSRRLLIVSYYSPPYKSSLGTQRLNKYMKYLRRKGWHIVLLTTQPTEDWEWDREAELIPEGVEVVRIAKASPRSGLIRKGFFVPDDYFRWVTPAVQVANRIIEEKDISIILSTAPPYSNLLVGALSSYEKRIPFVTDFRDPWTRIDFEWVIERPILRELNRWLEKRILPVSDTIIMADDIEYYEDYFVDASESIRSKLVSITNGYDEEDFADLPALSISVERFVVSYIGSFYDQETYDNVIGIFRAWKELYPEDLEHVVFSYAGNSSKFFAEDRELPMELKDHGFVSHQTAIALRSESTLQMFSQPLHFKPHFYSGKIFEMIRSGPPILAVTPAEGAVARLIEETVTGFTVKPGDYRSGAAIMKQIFGQWRSGTLRSCTNHEAVRKYSREAAAKKLDAELGKLVTITG